MTINFASSKDFDEIGTMHKHSADLLCHHLQIITLKRGRLYVDSPKWLKNKKATINLKKKNDDKCSQYGLTIPLKY